MVVVRLAGHWIVGHYGLVSSLVYKCVTCRRLTGLKSLHHSLTSGCNVFWPNNVQDRRTKIKRHGVIFTC